MCTRHQWAPLRPIGAAGAGQGAHPGRGGGGQRMHACTGMNATFGARKMCTVSIAHRGLWGRLGELP